MKLLTLSQHLPVHNDIEEWTKQQTLYVHYKYLEKYPLSFHEKVKYTAIENRLRDMLYELDDIHDYAEYCERTLLDMFPDYICAECGKKG